MKTFLMLGTFLTKLWTVKQLAFDVFESYKAILEVTRIFVANLTFCRMYSYLYDSNFQVDLQQCIEYFYNFKEPVLVSFLGYKKHSQMFFQTFFFYFSKKIKENFEVSSSRLLNFLEKKRFITCLLRKYKLQKMRIKRQTLQKVYIQEKL